VKVTVNRSILRDALKIVAKQSKSQGKDDPEFVEWVKVEVIDGEQIRLACTNKERLVLTTVQATVEDEPIPFCVPVKKMLEIVQATSDDTLTLKFKPKKLEIKDSTYKSSLTSYDPEKFPLYQVTDEWLAKFQPAKGLLEHAKRVMFAASKDNYRPAIQAVYFGEYIAATDGFRLAYLPLKIENLSALIPADAMKAIEETFKSEEISVYSNEDHLAVTDGVTILETVLVAGKFPDAESILPKKTNIELVLDTAEFSRCLKFSNVIARHHNGVIEVSITKEEDQAVVQICANASEIGNSTTEIRSSIIAPNMNGKPFKIGFNLGLLREGLEQVKTDKFKLRIDTALSPALMLPVDETDPWKYVVMPLKIG